jgi:mRNA interferase RelE/StbE
VAEIYTVGLTSGARKVLRKLDPGSRRRVVVALGLLRQHPRPAGATALAGHGGYLRVRVGDYRIVYTVKHDVLLVLVLAIGHRSRVYRDLP